MGEAIVGELTGMRLQMMPSRIESFSRFKEFSPKSGCSIRPVVSVVTVPTPMWAMTLTAHRSFIELRCQKFCRLWRG